MEWKDLTPEEQGPFTRIYEFVRDTLKMATWLVDLIKETASAVFDEKIKALPAPTTPVSVDADAIIAKIEERISTTLDDLRLTIEGSGNDMPKQVGIQLDVKLRESSTIEVLVANLIKNPKAVEMFAGALTTNPAAMEIVGRAISAGQRRVRNESEAQRKENIRLHICEFYNNRIRENLGDNLTDADLLIPERISINLVTAADKDHVLEGARDATQSFEAVSKWLTARETAMMDVVTNLVNKTKVKKETIKGIAGVFVLKGYDPVSRDKVREELESEHDVVLKTT